MSTAPCEQCFNPPPALAESAPRSGAKPAPAISRSAPRSNRIDASVRRPSAFDVRRIEMGSKQADSNRIFRVAARISVSAPPMTPAIATARDASAITHTSGVSARSIPSSVRIFFTGRTRARGPRFDDRSAGPGRMHGADVRVRAGRTLVASTTLLIEVWPRASRRCRIQSGDGPDSSRRATRASPCNGCTARGAPISTRVAAETCSEDSRKRGCTGFSGRRYNADASRAMP